jgi:glycosyltransferase involved in cell wall biosynthesis
MEDGVRKKILVVFPGVLFPVAGMSQVRTIQQIACLSKVFTVDLFIVANSDKDAEIHRNELGSQCRNVFSVIHPKHRQGTFRRVLSGIEHRIFYYLSGNPVEHQHLSDRKITDTISGTVKKHNYQMVISHYWHGCRFFEQLPGNTFKAIDTHYIVEENMEIHEKGLYDHTSSYLLSKELKYSKKKQNEYFKMADLLIFNSTKQYEIIKNIFPQKLLTVTPNGQELHQYLEYPVTKPEKCLVFYGALSNQFNVKAIKLLLDLIIPAIKEKSPGLKVMFVGNKPPEWLKSRDNESDFIVTGFVKDIRPYLSKSYLSVMPLTTASGFRGRTIELMALGVPVIGTHNALDCVEFEHGQEGFITDDVNEMIRLAVHLFEHPEERDRISENARRFVNEHYSIEATFSKLTTYIDQMLNA